jgi:mannosyltransferase
MTTAVATPARRWTVPSVGTVPLVACLTAAGAIVRFATLGVQSYWYDEATTVHLVRMSFGGMLAGVHKHETTPPLYFALAWVWTRLFGDSEVGLRSLSPLLGTLMIPVAYAAGRALVGRRAGVAAAALTALSPALVWYSQEARSYALLTFLCAVSLLFFARALRRPERRDLAGWALASAFALAAHYFGVFLVLPEAIWLLVRAPRRRAVLAACAPIAATAAALAPLVLYQRVHGGGGWIGATAFGDRLRHVPYFFAVGLAGTEHRRLVLAAAACIFALAVFFVARRTAAPLRSGALLALAIGAAAVLIPLAATALGSDYVLDRNLLPAWLPLVVGVAAGLSTRRAGAIGLGVLAAICAAFLAIDARVAADPHYQRDPWRTTAHALGAAGAPRVIEVAPAWQSRALGLYLPLSQLRSSARVSEVDTIDDHGFIPAGAHTARPPGAPFRRADRRAVEWLVVTRYEAPRPAAIQAGGPGLFLERPR